MKTHLIALAFSLSLLNSSAQEMWGTCNSNYSGTMGTFLNPSIIVGAPYKYELHFLSADIYAGNTYIYFPADKNILQKSISGEVGNERVLYDVLNTNPKSGFLHTLVIGPSFVLNRGESAWGIHTAYRNEISVLKVPYHLSKLLYENFDYSSFYNKDFSSDPFSAALLSWGEVGATYGRVFLNTEKDYVKWAATVNLLAGFDGAYLDAGKFDYTFTDSTSATIHQMDATFAHAVPDRMNAASLFSLRGFGVSTSLGATYIHNRSQGAYDCNKTSDYFSKYQYRIGLSFIDFGYIRFFNQAQVLTLKAENDRLWDGIDTAAVSSFSDFDSLLSSKINGYVSTEEKSFSMLLPSAISIQFDYKVARRLYANATFLNRIHFSTNQIARTNQVNLSLRYEKKRFEPAITFTLSEYSQPSMGIALRYSVFVIGTDRFLEWMSMADVRSFDFFFGLKTNLCEIGLFRKKSNCVAYGDID